MWRILCGLRYDTDLFFYDLTYTWMLNTVVLTAAGQMCTRVQPLGQTGLHHWLVVKHFISAWEMVLANISGEPLVNNRGGGAAFHPPHPFPLSVKNGLQLEKQAGPGSQRGLLFCWDTSPASTIVLKDNHKKEPVWDVLFCWPQSTSGYHAT